MRADVYLATHGLCESRTRAALNIDSGLLYVNGKNVAKCSFDISEDDEVELRGEVIPYVGRGGIKLAGAIEAFSVNVKGKVCVDIGASTGGFTDCLLKNGAIKVYAVENGSGQLHVSLLNDERVVSIEGFNARNLDDSVLGEKCDIAVMDVSFISQVYLHQGVSKVLKNGGLFISLIKPQFEVGREYIGRGGIVKDRAAHIRVIENVVRSAFENGLALKNLARSPITGGDGNSEYLALFELGGKESLLPTKQFLKKLTE